VRKDDVARNVDHANRDRCFGARRRRLYAAGDVLRECEQIPGQCPCETLANLCCFCAPVGAGLIVSIDRNPERFQAKWNRDKAMGFAALYPSYRNPCSLTRGMGRAQQNPSSHVIT
jgi:hypothetical protein